MEWTAEQRQVIDERRCSLIVSAAAGSGKTAVLVERICSLVEHGGADIGRMLVATFTRAAAAEMKSRIVQRLAKAAGDHPDQAKRLGGQLAGMDRASIGTLHSFCGELLRRYYNVAGIEPTFRTEDESVTRSLYEEAMQDTLDAFFEQGDAGFLALAGCWGGRDGESLAELAGRVYDAARNHPDHLRWLEACAARFRFADVAQTPWHGALAESLAADLEMAAESMDGAIAVAMRPDGPGAYLTTMEKEREQLCYLLKLSASGDTTALAAALRGPSLFGRLTACRGAAENGLKERAKELREEAKKRVADTRDNPLVTELEKAADRTREMAPQMDALVRFVAAFDRRYSDEKRYANVLDFADLEHMALAVLEDSAVRDEVCGAYDYVFVDEYQDISPVQDALLRRLSRPGSFFCVGDVKQSIYRFRSAEPEIFIRRLEASSRQAGTPERRMDLSRNFRSAARVVSLANFLFGGLMSRALGGVDYVGPERLVPAAPQPGAAMRDCRNELILIDNAGRNEEELTRLEELVQIEREATVVASRIRERVGDMVWDGKAGTYRKLRHSDVAVLLRTVSGVAAEYADVFRRAGIPVWADAEGGFAGELEVQLLMNALRLVDNPLRDYELITAMHSQIGRFSLEDLLEIRGLYRDGTFAGAVARYRVENDTELSARVGAFFERLELWRMLAANAGVGKLVWRICDDTGFYEYVGVLTGGARRQANIDALAALGENFKGGLYDFVRSFDRLAAGLRAKPAGQPPDAVTILSVHKSKGLEYPVVVLSNVGKMINLSDNKDDMLIHGELGLGPRWFCAAKRTKADTLARAALRARIRRDTLSEEMRMLYVAVTRARERLIITGTVSDLKKKLAKWTMPLSAAGLMGRARCWADWIGPMALRTGQGAEVFAAYGAEADPLPDAPEDWDIEVLDAAGIRCLRPQSASRAEAVGQLLRDAEQASIPDELSAAFSWRYPYGDVAALPSKVSATSLLDKMRNWRGPIPAPEFRRTPRFVEGARRFSATDLGTFVHTALQLLPDGASEEDVPALVRALEGKGLLPEGAADAIDMDWISRFLRSGIRRRMSASPRVMREVPFNLAVPAHVVYAGETSDEEILVQGIIDCCFLEGGEWVLLDYKTNRLDGTHTVESIAAHYRPQLQTYRAALEEITGIRVREAYLYLLSVGEEVRVLI